MNYTSRYPCIILEHERKIITSDKKEWEKEIQKHEPTGCILFRVIRA